ncbi:hypothetical protein [Bradyrhizobium sp.]|uniref:hypothetical protein n=1 Tax=Bradyrhizobium sp. TaxID=376 RepID=UPI0023A69596|nr:hypothetical protein [Bradyrhizobium sp.]MDE1936565.1 hypothetical protein [Bradyrhizobium sp.]
MPNADSECNSQQRTIENSLSARYYCHFAEIGRKWPRAVSEIADGPKLRRLEARSIQARIAFNRPWPWLTVYEEERGAVLRQQRPIRARWRRVAARILGQIRETD